MLRRDCNMFDCFPEINEKTPGTTNSLDSALPPLDEPPEEIAEWHGTEGLDRRPENGPKTNQLSHWNAVAFGLHRQDENFSKMWWNCQKR